MFNRIFFACTGAGKSISTPQDLFRSSGKVHTKLLLPHLLFLHTVIFYPFFWTQTRLMLRGSWLAALSLCPVSPLDPLRDRSHWVKGNGFSKLPPWLNWTAQNRMWVQQFSHTLEDCNTLSSFSFPQLIAVFDRRRQHGAAQTCPWSRRRLLKVLTRRRV